MDHILLLLSKMAEVSLQRRRAPLRRGQWTRGTYRLFFCLGKGNTEFPPYYPTEKIKMKTMMPIWHLFFVANLAFFFYKNRFGASSTVLVSKSSLSSTTIEYKEIQKEI
jgi:hypothetical protein